MKKLMIAAAAVAMIGATEAYALPLQELGYTPYGAAYDFSATLKTTKAKEGKGSTDKFVINLGRNDAGEWWYESDAFDGDEYAGKKVLKVNAKTGVPTLNVSKLDDEEKLDLAYELAEYAQGTMNGDHLWGIYNAEFEGIPETYKGKEQWCATFKFNIKNPGECYRVAGTEKLTATYVSQDPCCAGDGSDEDIWRLETFLLKKNDMMLPDLTTDLLYLFGAEQAGKANKVEFVGQIGNGVAANGTFTEDVLPTFALAGQGDAANLKDSNGEIIWGVKSISGNIVGIWYDPECEVCCGNNGMAKCWTVCCGCWHDGFTDCYTAYEYDYDEDTYGWRYGSAEYDYLWGTAAYGSFTLKFNSKNSEF